MARLDLPAVEVEVDCGGTRHVIRWEDGHLLLLGHRGDRAADDVVVALSGTVARCREIEHAWHSLHDERALVLLGLPERELDRMARAPRDTEEYRGRLARRDDISDAERQILAGHFDQMVFMRHVAALGGPFVSRRAAEAISAYRRRSGVERRKASPRVALGLLAARVAGAERHAVVLAPAWSPAGTIRVGNRVVGLVSLRWASRHLR